MQVQVDTRQIAALEQQLERLLIVVAAVADRTDGELELSEPEIRDVADKSVNIQPSEYGGLTVTVT